MWRVLDFSAENLKSLKVEEHRYAFLFVLLLNHFHYWLWLNGKLPHDLCLNPACKTDDDIWKLGDLLISEIEAKEPSITVEFLGDSSEIESYKNS